MAYLGGVYSHHYYMNLVSLTDIKLYVHFAVLLVVFYNKKTYIIWRKQRNCVGIFHESEVLMKYLYLEQWMCSPQTGANINHLLMLFKTMNKNILGHQVDLNGFYIPF